jgi:hypothetical protein
MRQRLAILQLTDTPQGQLFRNAWKALGGGEWSVVSFEAASGPKVVASQQAASIVTLLEQANAPLDPKGVYFSGGDVFPGGRANVDEVEFDFALSGLAHAGRHPRGDAGGRDRSSPRDVHDDVRAETQSVCGSVFHGIRLRLLPASANQSKMHQRKRSEDQARAL